MQKKEILKNCILALKGMLVGFGAIMPGISGGTLCVAFGMYDHLIGLLSHPRETLSNHWGKLCVFVLGAVVGFIGLSGLAGEMMKANSALVTCVFIGFVMGTLPQLWRDAGRKGRGKSSYISMIVAFVLMLSLLLSLKNLESIKMSANIWGFFFCGIVWGISFIVPGLSSSTLLIFFGLYQPMLSGISRLMPLVVVPLGLGFGVCALILPRAISTIQKKKHSEMSHAIIGIMLASVLMIFPIDALVSASDLMTVGLCILGGAAVSFCTDKLCTRLEK